MIRRYNQEKTLFIFFDMLDIRLRIIQVINIARSLHGAVLSLRVEVVPLLFHPIIAKENFYGYILLYYADNFQLIKILLKRVTIKVR